MSKITRPMTVNDVLALECDINNQMHILRHFDQVPDFYFQKIINRDFLEWNPRTREYEPNQATTEVIDKLLGTLGSKFNSIINPDQTPISVFHEVKLKLLSIMACETITPEIIEAYNLLFRSQEPEGLESLTALIPDLIAGYGSLISFDQMTTEELNSVYKGNRGHYADQFEVNIVDRKSYFPNNDVVIVVKKSDYFSAPKLVSCYNGILSPHYPNPKFQTEEELAISQEFWNRHAFIKILPD
jgi:hypothetical protein